MSHGIVLDGIRVLLRRPAVLLAVCALPFALLVLLYVLSQRGWQKRAAELQRENFTLQLRQLALGITQESDGLATAASELAESQGIVELVQDGTASSPVSTPAASRRRI